MAALLLPMLPGGSTHTDAERIAAIAAHPWQFRLGWFPWQLCALADLALAITMVRERDFPRSGSIAVLVLTMIAVVPDQLGEGLWVTRGVELARTDPVAYLALERSIFPLTAGWGALGYTLAALAWTWCFAAAKMWSRALSILSVPLWTTMLIAVLAPLLPESHRPSSAFVSTMNGLGFAQLQLWLGLVTERAFTLGRKPRRA